MEYCTDLSDLWGGDLPGNALVGVGSEARRAFQALVNAEKKWERGSARESPTWAENLPRIARWVRR